MTCAELPLEFLGRIHSWIDIAPEFGLRVTKSRHDIGE